MTRYAGGTKVAAGYYWNPGRWSVEVVPPEFALAAFRKVTGGMKKGAEELASTVSPGWTPGEAHMTGKPSEEKGDEKTTPGLEKLEKEIEARKGERK
jgi:hypothetical protein